MIEEEVADFMENYVLLMELCRLRFEEYVVITVGGDPHSAGRFTNGTGRERV
ncbi:hypothetical protein [Streptomyces violascens]|uniref:hypothetical protein n=1 Tax=Streptomyces violascens TaxID=67381 RepID=UPI00364AF340